MTTQTDKLWQAVRVRGVERCRWQRLASPGEPHINYKRLKVKAATITAFLHYSVSWRQLSVSSCRLPPPPLYLPLAARCRCHTNCRNTKSCNTHTDTQRESEGCWAALRTRKEKQTQKNIKKKNVKKTQTEKRGSVEMGKPLFFLFPLGNCETRINLIKYSLARSANARGHCWPRQKGLRSCRGHARHSTAF